MEKMNCCSSMVILLGIVAFLIAFHAETAEGKRGCATFGHSCYGGMGKRASDLMETNDEVLQNNGLGGSDILNPAFVFTGPRSEYKPPNGIYEKNLNQKMSPQQYDNISRVIRQWIQSYRRAQEDNRI